MTLKEEFKNKIVTAKHINGFVSFNTTETPESDYPAFYNLGFQFCFEEANTTHRKPIAYVGFEQEGLTATKSNQTNDSKKRKTKAKKA